MLEKVIQVDRVARTVKGGRRIRFRALVVVGDRKGRVGIGTGKATEVSIAVAKATTFARRHMHQITIVNETIPLEIRKTYGSAMVYMKPAPKGTSVIAGGSVRAIIEAAGIKNLVAKSLGSANKLNNCQATLLGLLEVSELAKKKFRNKIN
jgi:small subunit ribosomal protein S5